MTERAELARADRPCPLAGKNGLIAGIANDHSIAHAVAKDAREAGGDLAIMCALTAFPCSPAASGMTGQTIFVDAGAHIVA